MTDKGSLIEVDHITGRRLVAGRLRYPSPPEPGTIVGPKDITREHLVVLTTTPAGWTLFGYASDADLTAALTHAYLDGPRSLNERVGAGPFPALSFRAGA